MDREPQQIGRLALRVEGRYWNAYYALPDTMEDALCLGSIAMAAVRDEDRKATFMHLMQEAVADIIEAKCGTRPAFNDPVAAPNIERGGNA